MDFTKLTARYEYEYSDETAPMIVFDTMDRYEANKVFSAFLNNIITKIEFIPTEDDSFNRIYFDIRDCNILSLNEKIHMATNKLGFNIKII